MAALNEESWMLAVGENKEKGEEGDGEEGKEGKKADGTEEERGMLATVIATDVRAVVAEGVGGLRYALEQIERAALQREQVRNASIAQAIASLDGGIRALRRTVETRNQMEGTAPFALVSELELVKGRLKQTEMDRAELEFKLKLAEQNFEEMKRGGERARREADEALHREMLLRQQVVSLERKVARLDEVTGRLERSEKRNDEMREMIMGETREKEDFKSRAGDAERKAVRFENVVNILREKLKDFARFGEEVVGNNAEEMAEKERKLLEYRLSQGQSFGSGSLLYEELLREDRKDDKNKEWPESPLDRTSEEKTRQAQLEGLPADGGFGGPDKVDERVEEKARIESDDNDLRQLPGTGVDTIFSFSRGEFDSSGPMIEKSDQADTRGNTLLQDPAAYVGVNTRSSKAAPSSQEESIQTAPKDTTKSLPSNFDEDMPQTRQDAPAASSTDKNHALWGRGKEHTRMGSETKNTHEKDIRGERRPAMAEQDTGLHQHGGKKDSFESAKEFGMDKDASGGRVKVVQGESSPTVGIDVQEPANIKGSSSQKSKQSVGKLKERFTSDVNRASATPSSDLEKYPQRSTHDLASSNKDAASVIQRYSSDNESEQETARTAFPPTNDSEPTEETKEQDVSNTSDVRTNSDAVDNSNLDVPRSDDSIETEVFASSSKTEKLISGEGVGSSQNLTETRGVAEEQDDSSEKPKSYLEKLEAQSAQPTHSSRTSGESDAEHLDTGTSVVEPTREAPGQTASQTAEGKQATSVNELVIHASNLVKKARQRGLAISQCDELFEQALSKLNSALELEGEHAAVEAQMGATLLSWAKINITNSEAQDRLVRALKYLSSSLEKRPSDELTTCNTGLCLCLLASTSDAAMAKEYYEKACGIYDELLLINAESRIGSFNCGLTYISLGRLELREKDVDASRCMRYFEAAEKRFERSLELKPGDGKAQSYLDDCRREIAKLEKSS